MSKTFQLEFSDLYSIIDFAKTMCQADETVDHWRGLRPDHPVSIWTRHGLLICEIHVQRIVQEPELMV